MTDREREGEKIRGKECESEQESYKVRGTRSKGKGSYLLLNKTPFLATRPLTSNSSKTGRRSQGSSRGNAGSRNDTKHGQQGVTASREERSIGTDGAREGSERKEEPRN